MVGGAIIEINRLTSAQALKPLWTGLEARSEASFFLSWPWIETWLETSAATPYVVAAHQDEALVALALLQESRHRRAGIVPVRSLALHETGDAAMDSLYIEYNGLLRDQAAAPAVIEACLHALTTHRERWDEIRLSAIAADMREAAAATGWIVRPRAVNRCYAVDLQALRDARASYIDGLAANTRQQLRRTQRLYAARGTPQIVAAQSLAEAKAFLGALKILHQESWRRRGRPGAFAVPFFERFHEALLDRIWPQGGAELLKIAAGPHVLGYLYNFQYRGTVHNYQSGFVHEEDNKLKPGLLSHALCIERHLAGSATRYDFMAGAARHKQSLATEGEELVWLTLQRPGLLSKLESAARLLRRRLPG
jgi:CelD/BcsL family acetyltransferase involved in cellulose biosynthesis